MFVFGFKVWLTSSALTVYVLNFGGYGFLGRRLTVVVDKIIVLELH